MMTTTNEAKEAILARFVTAWAGETDVSFPNARFTPGAGAEYVRIVVRTEDRLQWTLGAIGNRRFRSFGRIFVDVFVPLDQGEQRADALATMAANVFEGASFSGVACFNAVRQNLGVDDEEARYHHQVTVDFDFEERK